MTYKEGYRDGYQDAMRELLRASDEMRLTGPQLIQQIESERRQRQRTPQKKKRKLSAWNKYVKANSKKPRFIYQSGAKRGRINLKKMAVAFRKTPAGRKSKRR
jgi:hypothetical protein